MKLTLKEMNGLLNGKCLPSDLIVGETLAEYLVRKFAEADAKFAVMAAENAELNEKMDKLATWPGIEFYSSAWEFNSGDGDDALEFLCDSETPATDSFLAEVRASAVDEACLKISNAIINCYQDEQVGLDAAETICGDFAAQLRQEAAQ